MDVGETCEAAAAREAKEETNIDVKLEALLGVYSDPKRDLRQHTMTVVYTATGEGSPVGMDDAAEARIFPLNGLPENIVFDHGQIIADYQSFISTGIIPPPKNREN